LIKSQTQLKNKRSLDASEAEELRKISEEIDGLGGLEWYQQMSAIGQGNDRGGGSERIFISWLKELKVHESRQEKLRCVNPYVSDTEFSLICDYRLLEVGALKPDNYKQCTSWIHNTPIDLRSRHPDIKEQDFLLFHRTENDQKWDAISLSLVVNFVPDSKDRGRSPHSLESTLAEHNEGRMLHLANTILKNAGYLFLAVGRLPFSPEAPKLTTLQLPLPCVANSRYMTFEHLNRIMETLGFTELKRRWKEGGKMAYWLYQKQREPQSPDLENFTKKIVLRTGNRNNFTILLER
jgi:25S rRNA (adenine2142-N1)-methyltransferase